MRPIIYMTMLLLLSFIVIGGDMSSDSIVIKNCEDVFSHYEETYTYKNSDIINKTSQEFDLIVDEIILIPINDVICKRYVTIKEVEMEYKLQDYNCKNTDEGIVCDSCIDGNCNGECDPNGGESCCKIKDGDALCKNGVISWKSKSKILPVKDLGATK